MRKNGKFFCLTGDSIISGFHGPPTDKKSRVKINILVAVPEIAKLLAGDLVT